MAVTDLQEGKPPNLLHEVFRERFPDEAKRFRYAAFDRPEEAGSSSNHAFENLAAV